MAPAPLGEAAEAPTLPRPHAAFPTGRTKVSAAAITAEPGDANAWSAAADTGRSPAPLLDTERPLTTSETCTTEGMADKLSQGLAWYCTTPVTACSER